MNKAGLDWLAKLSFTRLNITEGRTKWNKTGLDRKDRAYCVEQKRQSLKSRQWQQSNSANNADWAEQGRVARGAGLGKTQKSTSVATDALLFFRDLSGD